MSAEQEVQEIRAQVAVAPTAKAKENMEMAHREVSRLMSSSGSSLLEIGTRAETASTSEETRAAFREFNLLIVWTCKSHEEPKL